MVQEVRKIIFSRQELLDAFVSYARRNPHFLPEGKLIGCQPSDENSVTVKYEPHGAVKGQFAEIAVHGLDALKPLILFCIENNIMLPRKGLKAFTVIEGKAVMIVELDLETDVDAMLSPMLSEHIKQMTPAAAPKETRRMLS